MDIRVTSERLLAWRNQTHRCAIGHAGISQNKREGDGTTPVGCFSLRRVLYRPDRIAPPQTALSVGTIEETDGWCDDSDGSNYNRLVTLPYAGSHERLWREDALYDLVVVLGFNDEPPTPGAGSAVFLHVADSLFSPTAGCVALARDTLIGLLADCTPGDQLCVIPSLAS